MIIYPAIDLMDNKCVRLYQGDFEQKTNYDTSPVDMAKSYRNAGAEWLHLIDLDGAKDSNNRQLETIKEIIKYSCLKVQTGGGIRDEKDIDALLLAGANRIIIGSTAVKDIPKTKEFFKKYGGDKICLATDVIPKGNKYMIAISGWQEESTMSLEDLINEYIDSGLEHILCTDISKDGTMQGCNQELYKEIQQKFPKLKIQASGGVHNLDDLKALNTNGAIIGKALFEGAFTLKEALEAVK